MTKFALMKHSKTGLWAIKIANFCALEELFIGYFRL
jgi:hypothetical protein